MNAFNIIDENYTIMNINYKNKNIPILLNTPYAEILKTYEKEWFFKSNGLVYCIHNKDDIKMELFLHDIIILLKNQEDNHLFLKLPIYHINKITIDNRIENLTFDTKKNIINKKKRTLVLPIDSNVEIDELPPYIWYSKKSKSHGDYFIVNIDKKKWKTTSSQKVSLRYKLEEAKKYMRELKITSPNLFSKFDINNKLTKIEKYLLNSFYKIIYDKGYYYINKNEIENAIDKFIKEKPELLTEIEKETLNNQNFNIVDKRRRVINTLPPFLNNYTTNNLPKYCYYKKKNKNREDYFIISNHPSFKGNTWNSTCSNKVNINDKLNELLKKLDEIENKNVIVL
jgi:hypothetical protein